MFIVYLSLGSNVDADNQLNQALHWLSYSYDAIKHSKIVKTTARVKDSSLQKNKVPDYMNTVVKLLVSEDIHLFVKQLKAYEIEKGRYKYNKPLCLIDIDLLFIENQDILNDELGLPSSDIEEYAFVKNGLKSLGLELGL